MKGLGLDGFVVRRFMGCRKVEFFRELAGLGCVFIADDDAGGCGELSASEEPAEGLDADEASSRGLLDRLLGWRHSAER